MERSSDRLSSSSSSANSSTEDHVKNSAFNLIKQTELRLGLPGSQSPERKDLEDVNKQNGHPVSGAKRAFSDAIDDGSNEEWGLSMSNVCEADKGAALFASKTQQLCVSGQSKIELAASVDLQSPKPVQHKQKPQELVTPPAAKAQVVGWPPIRSFRKNTMASNLAKNDDVAEGKQGSGCLYVKVGMDGAPYLRKVDLQMYNDYMELSMALEKMFSCFIVGQCGSNGFPKKDGLSESRGMDLLHRSAYVLTFEDKDDDWMLVGDVPWGMFTETCRKLRIMKGSEAIGLAPRAVRSKNRKSHVLSIWRSLVEMYELA